MEFKNYGEAIKAIHDIQEPLREDIKNYAMKRIEEFERETGLSVCKATMILCKSYPSGRYIDVDTKVDLDGGK